MISYLYNLSNYKNHFFQQNKASLKSKSTIIYTKNNNPSFIFSMPNK